MSARKYKVTQRRTVPLHLERHQNASTEDGWDAWVRESDRPIAIDLFCGAGGLSHGLEVAGYRVALSVDMDSWALETHAHNLPGLAVGLDLGVEEARESIVARLDGVEVDLIAGGPPCQPYSRAGRSKIRDLVDQGVRSQFDHRKELWRAFLDVVERIRPRAVLMENVPDMALGDDMVVLRTMVDRLEGAGYEVDARILDAWRFGVPQHRQRLILVGLRDGRTLEWPEPLERVTVRDAIGDLPVLEVAPDTPIGESVMAYEARDPSDFARRARKECLGEAAWKVHDHHTRSVRHDDFEAFKLMSAGTLYSDLPEDLKRYRDDIFNDKYNRLAWSDLSRTITAHIAKDGYWYIHPEQHRTLTVREAARLQTFPDHFRFAGSRSHQFQQIGNAVPPILGEVIGSAIFESKNRERTCKQRVSTQRIQFRRYLAEWADKDVTNAPWAYPGDPWPAVVGILSDTRGPIGRLAADYILLQVPDPTKLNESSILENARLHGSERYTSILERIKAAATVACRDPKGWKSDGWQDVLGLSPAQKHWLTLLSGESEGLVHSLPTLRVASRVTGNDPNGPQSDRKMELAKLVGSSEEAARLNAAMHRLGATICKPKEPACQRCPVQQACLGRLDELD